MLLFGALLAISAPGRGPFDAGPKPLLMRNPTVSANRIAFQFAGEIWSVPREGGAAVQLTNGTEVGSDPHFSPDGSQIAFDESRNGQWSICVIPAAGGTPTRLTFDGEPCRVAGWSPDGKSVLYASSLVSSNRLPRLLTVPVSGGLPSQVPLPAGIQGAFSPDGKHLAYVSQPAQQSWKRYRGGMAQPIWIADLSNSKVMLVPRDGCNDRDPMWIGSKLYFASDRKGPFGLFSFDAGSGTVREEVPGGGFDIKSASAGDGVIVYEKFGSIRMFDPGTRADHQVPITIAGDFPETRSEIKNLVPWIANVDISPSGQRAVFEARGKILTVPAEKGDAHLIAERQGVAERNPAWSPDGKTIAFLSDESGEYRLVLHDLPADSERTLALGDAPAFYYSLYWSPDSKSIAYTDNRHNLWILDVASGKNTKIDTAPYEDPTRTVIPSWSPDSKWMVFHRDLDNHLNALFLYSAAANKTTQITDGLSNARYPVFDRGGKYIYFVASTNTGPSMAWLDFSSYNALNVVSSVYAMTLAADTPDPLKPESDEETPKDDKAKEDASKDAKKPGVKVDLEGIEERAIALPMPERNYTGLVAGPEGSVFALSINPMSKPDETADPSASLQTVTRFAFSDRKTTPFATGVTAFAVCASGEKLLMGQGPQYSIVSSAAPPSGQGALKLEGLTAKIEPRAEWAQMYHEVWREERDFFYDSHYHGLDLGEMEHRYRPFLANLCSRADLNYLFNDMIGEFCIGHMRVLAPGDVRQGDPRTTAGKLGADFTIENGRYRLSRIYTGESWNPSVSSPLAHPGIAAKVGEYVLAIDGQDLPASRNIYEALEDKAGKQVRVRLGSSPDGKGSREVVVVPVASEAALRNVAWEEDNRRTVDRLSGGRLGYAHIPDTNIGGWRNFVRYYYSQVNKEGMVIDERFNGGGQVDDYMVEAMNRPLASMWTSRYGKDFASPASANFGPKVLLINEDAGSGGDYFPWHFKQAHVGPVIGKRTWGGLVGILNYPVLVDGGQVSAPNIGFYNPNGTWDVENHGVDPDIDVQLDPYMLRQGHDVQLERGVQEAMKLLASRPKPSIKKPAYRDKTTLEKAQARG